MKCTQDLICRLQNGKHLNYKELIDLSEEAGFKYIRQSGSHRTYRNDEGKTVTITVNGHDIHQNSVTSVLKNYFPKHIIVDNFTKVPPNLMSKIWNQRLRGIREYLNLKPTAVAQAMDISVIRYRNIEAGHCKMFKDEINTLAKVLNLDTIVTADFPITNREHPPKPRVSRKKEEVPEVVTEKIEMAQVQPLIVCETKSIEDILVAAELKLNRFKELHVLLQNYDKIKVEYEDLKRQLTPLLGDM